MELTASGMEVAAARNVNPDIMVGICRRQSFHVALNIRTDLKCSFAEDAAPMTAATLAPAVSKDFPI